MSNLNLNVVQKILTTIKHAQSKKQQFTICQIAIPKVNSQQYISAENQYLAILNVLIQYGLVVRYTINPVSNHQATTPDKLPSGAKELRLKKKFDTQADLANSEFTNMVGTQMYELKIWLAYQVSKPSTELKLYYRAGHRNYWNLYNLRSKSFKAFPLVYVLSTNIGIITHIEALQKNVGGTPLFYIRLR